MFTLFAVKFRKRKVMVDRFGNALSMRRIHLSCSNTSIEDDFRIFGISFQFQGRKIIGCVESLGIERSERGKQSELDRRKCEVRYNGKEIRDFRKGGEFAKLGRVSWIQVGRRKRVGRICSGKNIKCISVRFSLVVTHVGFVVSFQKSNVVPRGVTDGRDGGVIGIGEPIKITLWSVWSENSENLVGNYGEVEKKKSPERPCRASEWRVDDGAVKFDRR